MKIKRGDDLSVFKTGDKVFYGGEECKVCCYVNGYNKDEMKVVAVEGRFLISNVSEDYLLETNEQYQI